MREADRWELCLAMSLCNACVVTFPQFPVLAGITAGVMCSVAAKIIRAIIELTLPSTTREGGP